MRLPRGAGLLGIAALVGVGDAAAQSAGPSVTALVTAMPPACLDSTVPPPERREPGSYRPPQRRRMVVPPLTAEAPVRDTIRVEFLVSAAGTVDSVAIQGRVRPAYREALRATLLTHTFWPAVYRGCAVPARMAVELSYP